MRARARCRRAGTAADVHCSHRGSRSSSSGHAALQCATSQADAQCARRGTRSTAARQRIALTQEAAQDRVDQSGRMARGPSEHARHRPPRPRSSRAHASSIQADAPAQTSSARRRASVCAFGRASSGSTAGARRRYQRNVPSATAWIARALRLAATPRERRPRRWRPSASTAATAAAAPLQHPRGSARGPSRGLPAVRCVRACAHPNRSPSMRVTVREIRGADDAPPGALQLFDRQLRLSAGHQQPAAAKSEHACRGADSVVGRVQRACARQILSGSPASEVCATGHGLQPLTWRAMCAASAVPVDQRLALFELARRS